VKTTNILDRVVNNNAKQSENKFIHNHEFVPAIDKEANEFCVQCITSRINYHDLCGKTLKNINRGFTIEKI
jgi:hypothetical protein